MHTARSIAIFSVLLGSSVGCYTSNMAGTTDEPRIVIERFSNPARIQPESSPHYRIELFSDGRGVYRGFKHVRDPGPVSFKVPIAAVESIEQEWKQLGFWNLEAEYVLKPATRAVTGLGRSLLARLNTAGKSKAVAFDAGANLVEDALLDAVEKVVNSAQWRCPYLVGTRDPKVDACVLEEHERKTSLLHFQRMQKKNERER